MKTNRGLCLVFLALSIVAVLGAAQNRSTGKVSGAAAQSNASSPTDKKAAKVQAPLNGDDVYKANCTRCHSEAVKVNPRATVTVMQHMRARANMSDEEIKAVIKYLQQ